MSQTLKLYIPKVLSENKIVLLKGIGALRINYRHAQHDQETRQMLAPREEIYFVPGDEAHLDPILIKVVELIARVDHEEAVLSVQNFMNELREELRSNGFLTFPSIGWIKQDHWGSLFFEPAAEYVAINRFFGLGQVDMPEALSAAEQEALADLKETVTEQTAHGRYMQQRYPERKWGFMIGFFLILVTLLTVFFVGRVNEDHSADRTEQMIPVSEDRHDLDARPETRKFNEAPVPNRDPDTSLPEKVESTVRPIGPDFIPTSAPIKRQAVPAVNECIIIVGAFAQERNVDRMIERIEETSHEWIVIEGTRLKKVGFKVACEGESDQSLDWARKTFDSAAWMLNKP